MLTGYGLLLVLGLGGVGLLPAALGWWDRRRGSSPDARFRPPTRNRSRASESARATVRPRALEALREPRCPRRSRSRPQTGRGARADRAERIGQDNGAEGPRRASSGRTTGSIALGDDPLEAATQRERARRGVVGTQQTTAIFPELTVLEHALVGAGLRRRRSGPFRTFFRTPKARAEEAEAKRRALGALDLVGLLDDSAAGPPPSSRRTSSGSSCWPRRLRPSRACSCSTSRRRAPRRPSSTGWSTCCKALRSKGLALLLIEHNLRFVRRVADEVTVLEAGRRIASGTLAEVSANEAVRVAYLGRQSL